MSRGDIVGKKYYGFPPSLPREWTTEEIDEELRQNGTKAKYNKRGFYLAGLIGATIESSPNVARAKFTINEAACDENGRLLKGIVDYLAESLGSSGGAAASKTKVVVGLELNRNYLRPAFVGQELTAIAKPLRKGSSTQVWEIKFEAENAKNANTDVSDKVLIALSRLTVVNQTLEDMEKITTMSKL